MKYFIRWTIEKTSKLGGCFAARMSRLHTNPSCGRLLTNTAKRSMIAEIEVDEAGRNFLSVCVNCSGEAGALMSKGRQVVRARRKTEQLAAGTKKCSACKRPKPLGEFSKSSHTWDKLQARCKACNTKYLNAWRKTAGG